MKWDFYFKRCDITLVTPISKDTEDQSFMVTPLLEDQYLEEFPRLFLSQEEISGMLLWVGLTSMFFQILCLVLIGQPIFPYSKMKRKMILVCIWLNSIYMYLDWGLGFVKIVSWIFLWLPYKTKLEYGMKGWNQEACVLLKISIYFFWTLWEVSSCITTISRLL